MIMFLHFINCNAIVDKETEYSPRVKGAEESMIAAEEVTRINFQAKGLRPDETPESR